MKKEKRWTDLNRSKAFFTSIEAKVRNDKKTVDIGGAAVAEKYYNERKLSALDINEHLDILELCMLLRQTDY